MRFKLSPLRFRSSKCLPSAACRRPKAGASFAGFPSAAIEHLENRRLLSGYTSATLASFNGDNGADPEAAMVFDSSDNLYGTTGTGGANGDGSVFEIAHGTTTVTTIASFDGTNGLNVFTPLVIDSSGNLYGTTSNSGANSDGSVYEVAHGTTGITTLASFNGANGDNLEAGLVMDSGGNLYGTASGGGANSDGTVFEIAQGTMTIITLASFGGANGDGPQAALDLDSSGNLYGTTFGGGANGDGAVFEVAHGTTAITTLASFNSTDGKNPGAAVAFDSSGNLYGTTYAGGARGDGVVYEIAQGSTTITPLVSFSGADGELPEAPLIIDSKGNLFGTTASDSVNNDGTAFEIAHGTTTLNTLVSFDGDNGATPVDALVLDSNNNLYGTTLDGGATPGPFNVGLGTVFELSPVASQLAFGAPPTGALVGNVLSPAVTVQLDDANGNLVAADISTVTVTIASGPSGATLGGTVSVAAVDGVATFTNLTLDKPGTYTLQASDGGLTAATSASFVEVAPTTTSLTTSSVTAAVRAPVTFTATVVPTSGSGATPTGNVTFFDGVMQIGTGILNSSGVATFADAALDEGGHSITADYSGDSTNVASNSTALAQTVFTPTLTPTLTGSDAGTIITTAPLKLKAKLTFAASNGAVSGPASARILLSPDETAANSVFTLASPSGTIKLKAGKDKSFNLKLPKSIPSTVSAGVYHVLIETTDTAGNVFTTDSGKTLTIAAANVDLAGSFVKATAAETSGKKYAFTFNIQNLGNVTVHGPLTIETGISPDGTTNDLTSANTFKPIPINLAPMKRAKHSFSFKPTSSGTYFVVVDIDPNNTFGDSNLANNVFATQITVG